MPVLVRSLILFLTIWGAWFTSPYLQCSKFLLHHSLTSTGARKDDDDKDDDEYYEED